MKASRLVLFCFSFACAVLLLAALLARPNPVESSPLESLPGEATGSTPSPTPACCQNGVTGNLYTTCIQTGYYYIEWDIENSCPYTVTAYGGVTFNIALDQPGPWRTWFVSEGSNINFPPGHSQDSMPVPPPLPEGYYYWQVDLRFIDRAGCWQIHRSSAVRPACELNGTPPPTLAPTHTSTTGPTSVPPTQVPSTSTRTATTPPTVLPSNTATSSATLTPQPRPGCGVGAWCPVPNPLGGALSDLEAIASDDVWAVGENGAMHWDGQEWRVTSVPVTETLEAISAAAPDDVWAVGLNTIIHWDGAAWVEFAMPVPGGLYDVDARAPDNVWAVGYTFDPDLNSQVTLAIRWDGSSWTRQWSPNNGNIENNYYGVEVVEPNDVWVVGGGVRNGVGLASLHHWDGSSWWSHAHQWQDCGLTDIEALTSTDIWAVGGCWDLDGKPHSGLGSLVLHYSGGTWSQIIVPNAGILHGIEMLSPSEGWAVADVRALHWNGTAWTALDTPHSGLHAVAGVAPDDVWAAGLNGIMHYTPALFSDVPPGHTFYPFIQCLGCRGIVSGYADGTFRPGNNVTRGQLSKIVANAAGYSDPITGQTFEDVPPDSTFYVFIERLYHRGILGGYPCGSPGEPCVPPTNRPYFRPQIDTTRGQVAKIACTAWGCQEAIQGQTYQDVPPDNPFYAWIERLSRRGIMSGYPCGAPGEPCVPPNNRPYFRWANAATRGQVSKIVANTFYPGCVTLR
jgi:hypothetical protein